ncbi:MAG: DUF4982 domain-containing protein, partial [Pontiellaceae bacterium]|nr:DUF4982 domain-containing protein [Pontiellaceae bacterium]
MTPLQTHNLCLAGTMMFLCAGCISAESRQPRPERQKIDFTTDWRFQKGDPEGLSEDLSYEQLKPWLMPSANRFISGDPARLPEGSVPGSGAAYTKADFDDSGWRRLNLPHDWGIEGPFDQNLPGETAKLPWFGVAWYRKTFDLPASDQKKIITLQVDGAMSYASVWCNGEWVGGWPYGYATWQLDLTPHLKFGAPNTLAIRIDNPEESSRWYPGGGIYRNVWLIRTAPVHIAQWGVQLTTPQIDAAQATVQIETTVQNETEQVVNITTATSIFEWDAQNRKAGKPVASQGLKQSTTAIPAGTEDMLQATLHIPQPRLWSPDHPALYVAVTTVRQGARVIDQKETRFGIRTAEFSADKGFLLNGKVVKLQGVCLHHDLGALGAAYNVRASERQLEIMKAMGVNAIRTSHNPPAPEFLDLCDRMGLLVIDELTDTWTYPKKPKGYAILFKDWSEADLRAMIRRDRNHPSVIAWSTGNEIGEQGDPKRFHYSEELTAIAHNEDPTRPVTTGNDRPQGGYNGYQKTIDIFGYNYKPHEYEKFMKANPDQPLYGSETASTISSRGEYLFPVDEDKDGGKIGFQMSSYDLYAPRWAQPADWEFKAQDQYPAVAGEFVWTGFDYLGEPTPFNSDLTILSNYHSEEEKAKALAELEAIGKIAVPSRSSYFGIVDLAGFPKDRYYLYQARWRPELPMAHILPHWNWPERIGEVTPVHVYTSGDEAELFLNKRSLGRKKKGEYEYRLRWDDVVYEPGELKVIAYKNGQPWAEAVRQTTGPAHQLQLAADRESIAADGRDLAFVTLTVQDADGR